MISVFLPTRKGSERVINKNTRDFNNISGGLLFLKISELLKAELIDEIILSTNDSLSIEIASRFNSSKIIIDERPEELAQSNTSLLDLVAYVPTVCKYPNILWTHVTSPFIEASDYDKMIETYFNQLQLGYDSLMTVKAIKNFVWDETLKDIVNRVNDEKWPRTQDLEVLFEIDSAAFINSKEIYLSDKNRIGQNPYLYELSGIKGFDIDWQDDFNLAEKLHNVLSLKS
jgi:CMP-N-acetylneuraminic acid synthetase